SLKMEKVIIGYNAKNNEYRQASQKIINDTHSDDVEIQAGSEGEKIFKELGVLDLWFNPVYKEELEVGKWYKHNRVVGFLFCYNGKINTPQYGFDMLGGWCTDLLNAEGTHGYLHT